MSQLAKTLAALLAAQAVRDYTKGKQDKPQAQSSDKPKKAA